MSPIGIIVVWLQLVNFAHGQPGVVMFLIRQWSVDGSITRYITVRTVDPAWLYYKLYLLDGDKDTLFLIVL